MKFDCNFYENLLTKFISLKYEKNNGYFTLGLMHIYGNISLNS